MCLISVIQKLGAQESRPVFLKTRSAKWFIESTVCFATFTDVFLYGVIVPVLPLALPSRANIPPNQVQHFTSILISCYGGALLVAAPICGMIADRSSSRRAPLLGGLLVLAAATVMLCVGRSIGVLVAGRIFQGLSAAVVWTVGLALLADTVTQGEVGQAMGYVAFSYSMGVLTAPLLGGVVYARAGYDAVFFMTFAIIAVDIVLRLALVEKKIAAKWLVVEGVILQGRRRAEDAPREPDSETSLGRTSPLEQNISSRNERNTESPQDSARRLPPMLILLKSRRILAAFWGTFVIAILTSAFDSTLPLFVHHTFGWNSLGGGLIFLALIIPSFSGPFVGNLCDKYGPRWLTAVGLVFGLPFWVLLRTVDHHSVGQIVLLCALLTLIGCQAALVIPPVMAEFTSIVQTKEKHNPGLFGKSGAYATSYSLFNVSWAAGSLVGPIWAGYVNAAPAGGWPTMTWSLGVFSAISCVPAILYTGGLITRKRETGENRSMM